LKIDTVLRSLISLSLQSLISSPLMLLQSQLRLQPLMMLLSMPFSQHLLLLMRFNQHLPPPLPRPPLLRMIPLATLVDQQPLRSHRMFSLMPLETTP